MDSVLISLGVIVLTFVAGLLGLRVQTWLAAHNSVDNARDMIASVLGLLTLLLALVLGTLIGNTYYFSTAQQGQLQSMMSSFIMLDKSLADFGPETKPVRDGIKAALERTYDNVWVNSSVDVNKMTAGAVLTGLAPLEKALNSLDAKTPEQKAALASAQAQISGLPRHPHPDVAATRGAVLQGAARRRHRLGGAAVLRLRAAVQEQHDDLGRAGLRVGLRRLRDLHHRRTRRALFGSVPHLAGGARADHRRDRPLSRRAAGNPRPARRKHGASRPQTPDGRLWRNAARAAIVAGRGGADVRRANSCLEPNCLRAPAPPRSRARRPTRLTRGRSDYAPLPGIPDEFIGADGERRPHWTRLLEAFAELGPDEVAA